MPRPKRLNLPGVPQHVTQRGNNRQACFFEDADYRLYLSLLAVACQRHQCAVHAYVLMTNHVHLLFTPEFAQGVSLVMRDLGQDYVRPLIAKILAHVRRREALFDSTPRAPPDSLPRLNLT
jgi:putative transposase